MGKWIQKAVKHPGLETKKAKAAGMSVQAYAQKHKHDKGKAGARARFAIAMKKMAKESTNLSELSDKTMLSYVHKSTHDIRRMPHPSGEPLGRKSQNARKGFVRAVRKLRKRNPKATGINSQGSETKLTYDSYVMNTARKVVSEWIESFVAESTGGGAVSQTMANMRPKPVTATPASQSALDAYDRSQKTQDRVPPASVTNPKTQDRIPPTTASPAPPIPRAKPAVAANVPTPRPKPAVPTRAEPPQKRPLAATGPGTARVRPPATVKPPAPRPARPVQRATASVNYSGGQGQRGVYRFAAS